MLLSIDTCGSLCSSSLYDITTEKFHFSRSDEIGRGHSEHLLIMITEEFDRVGCDWQDIDRLAVVRGPGSFTGLRVGLATARALSLAMNIPCNGVSVFDALAFSHSTGESLSCLLDARRDQIWMQHFTDTTPLSAAIGISSEAALSECPLTITRFVGSASSQIASMRDDDIEIVSESDNVDISAVARLVSLQPPSSDSPLPLYLRLPDAKPQKLSI